MTMKERAELAAGWKRDGVRICCQSVTLALADQCDLTEEQLRCLSSGFAVGMGDPDGTCGSLVGACMIAGLRCRGDRALRYTRQIAQTFRELSGAVSCGDLKGRDTGVVLSPCDQCVRNAILAYAQVMGEE